MMKTILSLAIQLLFMALAGWSLLCLCDKPRPKAELIPHAILLGFYLETITVGCLLFSGLTLETAFILTALGMLLGTTWIRDSIAKPFGLWRFGVGNHRSNGWSGLSTRRLPGLAVFSAPGT